MTGGFPAPQARLSIQTIRQDAVHDPEDHPVPSVAPTYHGPCRLLDWRQGARDGMTVDFNLGLPGPFGGHPFRGMPTGKETGQRFRIRTALLPAVGGRGELVYDGESVLLRWSENDRTGMMVRFLMDDGPDGATGRHPFFGLAVGRSAGEPMDLTAIGIADDETALAPSRIRRKTPFHQLTEVQQSHVLCRDPRFRAFLERRLPDIVSDPVRRERVAALTHDPEEFANAAVREALCVPSRAIMNRDGAEAMQARTRWRRLLAIYEDELWGPKRGTRSGPDD